MKTRSLLVCIAVLAISLIGADLWAQGGQNSAAQAASPHNALARDLLKELVEIDTSPTKGSTKAAEAMAARLRTAGFPEGDVLVIGPRPDRQNVVARLRGKGQGKPILIIAHLDVVAAPPEGWSPGLKPFVLTERNGYFYARGVQDNKCHAAVLVANLIRLRAEGFVPNHDILVALTADEETGGDNGVEWLLAHRRDLLDVAYCLNMDGISRQRENGQRVQMPVQTCEKTYITFRAEATAPGGHSSLPGKENAIYRLANGLVRLEHYDFPFRFNDTTRSCFERLSKIEKGEVAADMKAVIGNPPDLDAAKRLAGRSPFYNAILRTTCVATRLEAGHGDNALPQTARATINCRAFPGDTTEFVRKRLVEALADPQIKVTVTYPGRPSPVSPLSPEVMGPIEKISHDFWPDLPVLPVMSPWATDSEPLRRAGIATFGVSGISADGEPHGVDERLPVDAFYEGNDFTYRLLKML